MRPDMAREFRILGENSMMRAMLTLASVMAVVGAGAPAIAGECKGCDRIAETGEGFCCGKGKIFGVELTSRKLFDSLGGKKFEADKIKCPGCKLAAEKSGTCDDCKVAAAHGKFYHSMVAHALAKGKPYTAEKAAHCSECKSAYEDNGFCTGCSVGFVAGRMFKGRESYDTASEAHKTIVTAINASKKCEACAVAMVNDGTCETCKIEFKDGKKVG